MLSHYLSLASNNSNYRCSQDSYNCSPDSYHGLPYIYNALPDSYYGLQDSYNYLQDSYNCSQNGYQHPLVDYNVYSCGFKSMHTGNGCNMLLGDGSVHFFYHTVDYTVWNRLGSRKDGQQTTIPKGNK